MSTVNNNSQVSDTPKTPEASKETRILRAIQKAPSYRPGETPSLRGKVKQLLNISPHAGTVSGVKIEVTPNGVRIQGKYLGSGFTSEVHQITRFDKNTGEMEALAMLESHHQSVLKRTANVVKHLKDYYKDRYLDILPYLGLPLRLDTNKENEIKSLLLRLQGQDLSEVNPSFMPLHFYATELASAAKGLAYLHQAGLVHCDLKADNILSRFNKNGEAQLADFGFTRPATQKKTKIGGASSFFAPEIYATIDDMKANQGMVNSKTDIYTWGLMMRNMMVKQILPKFGIKSEQAFEALKFKNIDPNNRSNYGRIYYNKGLDQFIGFATDIEYKKCFKEVIKSPKLNQEKKQALQDFMNYAFCCTSIDPTERPTAEEITAFLNDFAKRTEKITSGRKLDFGPSPSTTIPNYALDENGYALYSVTEEASEDNYPVDENVYMP